MSANAKSKERIAELQEFVARFSANKSKASQATSRLKMIKKIKDETVEVKPSSRQNPYIVFEQTKPLHRLALEVEHISKTFDRPIISKFSTMVDAGDKIAIIGGNGVGKTTLLRILQGELAPDSGTIKWSENADVGYMAQDVAEHFDSDELVMEWMGNYRQAGDDDQAIRGVLGKLLFSGEDVGKKVKVLSGGEKHRMSFGRLMLGRHNVLMLDEPTNHLDMESIESLQLALEKYKGTVFIVSHDRQFIDNVATRVIEVKGDGTIIDFRGDYEEYLDSQGIEG
jgi:ATPase subunit of ABC transporter with duplicated ATPase domains